MCVHFHFFLNDIFVHHFMRSSFFPFSVLRNVLWVERGDAQTNRDLQAIGCHYTTSFAILICRGNILPNISKVFILNIFKKRLSIKNLSVLITSSFCSIKHKLQWQWTGPNKLQWRNWMQLCRWVSDNQLNHQQFFICTFFIGSKKPFRKYFCIK